jgi:succinate dehydrogenase flavin-adding protein (antitoxin of CptAB toxin-antitoxin module)
MEKIQQILLDLSSEAAFSGEAMKQFLELKGEVDSQESTITYLRRLSETDKDKIGDLNSKIRTLEGVLEQRDHELTGWLAREHELKDREEQRVRQEVELACETKRVEDHQTMVGLIFRNTELRKRVIGNELVTLPGTPDDRDEYGNIRGGTGRPPEAIGVPIVKDETETKE